jgi:DNA polymerase-1
LYNNPAKWIETKAYYGYLFFKSDKAKIPAVVADFEKAIALKGSINFQFVPMYFDMVEKNYTLNQAYAPEQVLSIFDKSNKILDAAAATGKDVTDSKSTLETLLVKMKLIDCEFIETKLGPKLAADPTNEELAEQISQDKENAKAKAFKVAGEAFAINSVPAKQKLLFDSIDGKKPRIVPNTKFKNVLTPKGFETQRSGGTLTSAHYSVSADALEYYRGKDDLVDALLGYQDLNKLMTTYVTPYAGGTVERETNGKKTSTERKSLLINGRVHTNFKSHGAETGRFSSSEPNLQNIPSSGDYGKLIRNLFVAPPGHKLVIADYSQIEPRVIASFSDDPLLVDNYMTGKDIYTTIGDTMGVDRKAGKVLVLAISYGVGPDKIAASIGCTLLEAKKLLRDFEAKFLSIPRYKGKVVRMAKQSGPVPFVETIFGRRRYIPDLLQRDPGLLARAERQAFNTVIQGSAADIMKLALVRAHSCFIDEPDINVILTVHDELVTITPEDRADEVAEAIRVSMEGIQLKEITVPLIADVKIVDKWGEAK